MRGLAFVAVLLVAGAARADWTPPRTPEWVALGAVEGLIAADLLQTRDALNRGGAEFNPLLGGHPSMGRLFVSGVLGGATTAAAFYFLPAPWRYCVLAGVGGAEAGVVIGNHNAGLRIRF